MSCHSRNPQSKEHNSNQIVLIPTRPNTFPHYLKQSPYGLESEVHRRQGLSEFFQEVLLAASRFPAPFPGGGGAERKERRLRTRGASCPVNCGG